MLTIAKRLLYEPAAFVGVATVLAIAFLPATVAGVIAAVGAVFVRKQTYTKRYVHDPQAA